MNLESFISSAERDALRNAIEAAEKQTSGEIRVHIESSTSIDPFQRGLEVFTQLSMDQTKLKNGVLIYLAYQSKSFAIVADKGINDLVPKDFWQSISEKMAELFRNEKYFEGLSFCIQQAGSKLSTFFPFESHLDKNELNDDISYGE